jgi:predicted GNAT family N-acyltransferase
LTADCNLTVEVRRARSAAEVEAALALRVRVFCEEQGVAREEELDGLDDQATQIVALDESRVIATCRLRFVDGAPEEQRRTGGTCKLERMAVEARSRMLGVGGELLAAAEELARSQGAAEMALNAQRRAEPFYAAHGYVSEGAPFVEAGIEHVAMRKAL